MNRAEYNRIKGELDKAGTVIDRIRILCEEDYEEEMIRLTWELGYVIETLNFELTGSRKVSFCDLDCLEKKMMHFECREELAGCYSDWKDGMAQILERRYCAKNVWDEKFLKLMDYICFVDFDVIVKKAKESLLGQGEELIKKFCIYYQEYSEMWGTLDTAADRYDVIVNRVTALKEHREDFLWLYHRLGDWRSKIVLCSMLYNWLTFDLEYINVMKEGNFTDYFDLDLVQCDEREVVVDLGAWTGDSVENYIRTYGKYKKIFCYEIDPSSVKEMKKNLAQYPDIEYRNKAVGSKNSMGSYVTSGPLSTINKITDDHSGTEIEIVSLDSDIDEKITLIKMDIEGAEQDALSGCERHIREEQPRLLISVYHNNEDIWKIPRMISDMNPDYRFYLRSNGWQWGPAEIVLLAI